MRTCTVDGCDRPFLARGMCNLHYQRAKRAAAPKTRPRLSDEEKARARALFDDGASRAEVARTLGRHKETIAAHFPDDKWSDEEVGAWRAYVTKHGAKIRELMRDTPTR